MLERDLIQQIAEKANRSHPGLKKGIGDDCAVFRQSPDREWLISTDMLVEGIHFDTRWHQPYLLGRKSIAVNISDIAAMGGRPEFALLSVGMSANLDNSWAARFLDGVLAILDEYHCVLIGGDTVSAEHLTISVTVLGTAAQGHSILRDGAAPGDSVYVSGHLGSSAAGLYLCKTTSSTGRDFKGVGWQQLVKAHLAPTPRVALAEMLMQSGMVTSMQDISDGIATDLSHICTASMVAAVIEEKSLPAHTELVDLCTHFQLDQAEFQLKGGEDYELVFTVQGGRQKEFEQFCRRYRDGSAVSGGAALPPVTRIGEVVAGRGVQMRSVSGKLVDIEYQGYEHSSE